MQSWLPLEVTEADVAPYVGTYATEVLSYDWTPSPFSYDLVMRPEGNQFVMDMQLSASGGRLPFGVGLLPLPQAHGIFHLAFLENGEAFQTLEHMFEFLFDEEGNVTGFEARTEKDALWMRGTKR